MTGRPRNHVIAVQHLTAPALRLALALAERLLPTSTYDGDPAVDPRDARFLLSGQLGVWDRWRGDLDPQHRRAVDRLIALRPRRLATGGGFRVSLARHLCNGSSPRYEQLGDLLRVHDGIPAEALIASALAELKDAATGVPAPPVAQPGQPARMSSSSPEPAVRDTGQTT